MYYAALDKDKIELTATYAVDDDDAREQMRERMERKNLNALYPRWKESGFHVVEVRG